MNRPYGVKPESVVTYSKSFAVVDIDWLKENCQRIYFFGLGFIQVVIDQETRYHFYHPDLPATVETPHNHRYYFRSFILKGRFYQKVYNLVRGDRKKFWLYKESCSEDREAPKARAAVDFELLTSETYEVGSSYLIGHETFHTVGFEGPTITMLKRSEYKKEFADVSCLIGEEPVCPFANKMSEEELWAKVEEVIND